MRLPQRRVWLMNGTTSEITEAFIRVNDLACKLNSSWNGQTRVQSHPADMRRAFESFSLQAKPYQHHQHRYSRQNFQGYFIRRLHADDDQSDASHHRYDCQRTIPTA